MYQSLDRLGNVEYYHGELSLVEVSAMRGHIPFTPFGNRQPKRLYAQVWKRQNMKGDHFLAFPYLVSSLRLVDFAHSIRGSSNGRTAAFEAVNLGSIPSPRTITERSYMTGMLRDQ